MLVFVGIDPGTTVGYCILGLDGNIIGLGSRKELSANLLVKLLSREVSPILAASDKKKVPSFVRSVAISLGAVIYSPAEDISIKDKLALTKGMPHRNSHERDALASALFAYHAYKGKFKYINSFLASKEMSNLSEKFIAKSIKYPSLNYAHLLSLIDSNVSSQKIANVSHVPKPQDKKANMLKKMIKLNNMLIKENIHLKELLRIKKNSKISPHSSVNYQSRKTQSEKELMKIISFKEQRFHSVLAKLKDLERQNDILLARLQKIADYASKKEYIFIDYAKDLTRQISNSKIMFIMDPNVYTQKSITSLDDPDSMIISPVPIKGSLREKLTPLFFKWDGLFYDIIAEKAVIKESDLKRELSKITEFESILSEYKKMRKKELEEKK
jgi:predicted RNase H-like nuclease (RuvC/YqgF family)